MKFIHTADWQIGKPFGQIEDESARIRLQDQRIETIKKIGQVVEDENADFVVVAGDLFDSNTPDKSTVSALCAAVGKIRAPVYVMPGNHDIGGPGTIYQQRFFLEEKESLSPNMKILLESKPVDTGKAILLPCPCLYQAGIADPLEWLVSSEIWHTLAHDLPRIVIAHGSITGFITESDNEEDVPSDIINLDLIPMDQLDYIALGDWHGTKQITEKSWYSGTHEQDRFPKGENYNPGNILIISAERGMMPKVKIVKTSQIIWHHLEHNIYSKEQFEILAKKIDELTKDKVRQSLLKLDLKGMLSVKDFEKFRKLIEKWKARFLHLKLKEDLRISPDDKELHALSTRSDPMIASVAKQLIAELQTDTTTEKRKIVTLALRELYSAVCGGE